MSLDRDRSSSTKPPIELSIGADVIVVARVVAVAVLAAFLVWVDVPYKGLCGVVLALGALHHVAWWGIYVRGKRLITLGVARTTLLSDALAIGVAVLLTGGADSPVVLVWTPTVAVAGIWIGVRASIPVLGSVVAFLAASVVWDPGTTIEMTELQQGVFAAFILGLVVAHGGVVAARQRAALGALEAANARARQDPLTGLSNRTGFEEQLAAEFERAERYGHPLALAILDMDDFKVINDTRGHVAGDEVLIHIAEQLRSEMRQSDTAVRLGGEEFVMLLPETGEAEATALAERIRARIAASDATHGATISIGIASYPRSATGPRELVMNADSAMYAAKRLGKNRTVVSEPGARSSTEAAGQP